LEVTDPHVTARVEGSRLGHTAVFHCPTGFVLNGTSNLTCHATGKLNFAFPPREPIFPSLRGAVFREHVSGVVYVISILPDQQQQQHLQKSKFNNHRRRCIAERSTCKYVLAPCSQPVAEKVAKGAHSNGPRATISDQFIAGGAGGERLNENSALFINLRLLFVAL
jgi:hypothetical protein